MTAKPGRARGRPVLLALLALLCIPGTWLRTPTPGVRVQSVEIDPVAFTAAHDWPAGLSVQGTWQMRNADLLFGGFSAMLPQPGGRVWAYSDMGERLIFTLPGHGGPRPQLASVPPHKRFAKPRQDIEAAVQDPVTGRYWLIYEGTQLFRRFDADGTDRGYASPLPMQRWPTNSSAEAVVRLADGHFLAFGEDNGLGMLSAGDPVDRAPYVMFKIAWPDDYHPVDAVQLPDGRVLILLRRVARGWPAFRSRLVIADPATIAARTVWRPQLFADLEGVLPRENYEGMALEHERGALNIWLISDNNFSVFQRTLLAKLHWQR